jgi:glycerol-3-phosphate dehydrogenase
MSDTYDILVVGGGINGVGIARDAAGRGLRVLLCEKGDLAGATSSASSKLIHGGLRYLEHYEFRLVREALAEREVLLRIAPHMVYPARFVLPHAPGLRPRWMVRAGLFLYDRLGGAHTVPGARSVDLRRDPMGALLRPDIRHGFVYSDCRVDDARLTVVNARDAAMRGAEIRTHTTLISASRHGTEWRARLQDDAGDEYDVVARILVNAGGPWIADLLRRTGLVSHAGLRLVKGSHIVVPRLYQGEHAFLLQNDDHRIVFVIPYEREFTLIGTTEFPFAGNPADAQISTEEIEYLCRAVGRWFPGAPEPRDIVWTYAGVRPLYEDHSSSAAAVTRDYVFELDENGPPALSVFGGKLTTYRRLAEHALERLAPHIPGLAPAWTADALLPGGEGMPAGGVAALATDFERNYSYLNTATAQRLARSYGTDVRRFLTRGDPGRDFGHGLFEAELRWLVEHEWARTAEDVLWRRTKLGLHFGPEETRALDAYLAEKRAVARSGRPAALATAPAEQMPYR